MRFVVDAGEMLKIKVGVDLGRADIGVAQEFLHRPEVATGLEQVGGEGMPQLMGMDAGRHAETARPLAHAGLNRAGAQATAEPADEQRLLLRALQELAATVEPSAERFPGLAPHRDDPLLAAFARDPHEAIAEIQIGHVEAGQLRQSQPRGIEQLHDRAVPQHQRFVALELQQPRHLIHVQGLGQMARQLRRRHVAGGVRVHDVFPDQEGEEAPQGGQPALDAAGGEAPAVAPGGKGANMIAVHRLPARQVLGGEETHQGVEVTAVILFGVDGHPPFVAEIVHVIVDSGDFESLFAQCSVPVPGRAAAVS
jgi:hypothetical protein